ncbi:dihydrolipoyl dehydrogenase [Thiocystis violascens]|uniref:Pyruvate/2-oxoglutarate dehydrogenase complex, dihydrolipoamide dehydrogenase component n=1 Tax=Thiocystis violascens (strain ATCC 17096 / DSM 198 / 6111) TaxID=765911 RepID=I3Y525_THIV6|nr:dihydrolipoyl dehydrogenase [Thiocystis violascens]AFL72093.1 pyruvate/2-oxoglutarate dehydrogenase complex, dihydrolipoamide dehydrogenase component [Thiocystis violascens DSM 198]
MTERVVDVAIIGSGSAGLNALAQTRRAGKTFVLINGGEPGTTCARVGCMPSKAMIQVAEDYHRRTHLGKYGIDGHEAMTLDIPEALEHVQDLRDTFVDRVLGSSTDDMPEDLFIQDHARFIEPTLIEAAGQRIRAGAVVIATGSRPVVPAAWTHFGERVITTDDLFELADLPASMAVIGLGTIGLELGQSLSRLGVDITGFDQLHVIAGTQDPEVSQTAIDLLGKEFPIHLGQAAEIHEEGEQLRVTAGAHSVVVDKVLCSIGRAPNVAGLQLENLGVPLDARGLPTFDPNSMQVGDLPVFIAGDVTGDLPLLHEAGDEGRIAGYNAAHGETARFRRKTPLFINFCDPNICAVGLRWNQLDMETTAVGQIRFAPVGRALIMGKNRGVLRVYADKASGRLLGAEMIGPKGEHLAHLLCWCIERNLTVGDLLRLPFYHPVIEEALQAALYDLYAKVDTKNEGGLIELARLPD